MKIGIIAASGKAGQELVKTALKHQHDVVMIIRDQSRVLSLVNEHCHVAIASLDDIDSIKKATNNIDVLINAYGPREQESSNHDQYAQVLANVVYGNKKIKRLIIVGGAGSLLTSDHELVVHSDLFLPEWRPHAQKQVAAFKIYQQSNINWTYFSPSLWFLPDAPKAQKIIYGHNHLLFNDFGTSKLGYADMAEIIIKEIEQQKYEKQRFTAVENDYQ